METKLQLFRMNHDLSNDSFKTINNVCTPELCIQNFKNGIETTIFLDTNIISNIRKFTFKEPSLDSRVCFIIEQIIEIFSKLLNVYISPGLAFYESCDALKEKNIMAFNIFLEQYLPKYVDAYNSLDYQPLQKQESFYLLHDWASIFLIQYVRNKYSHLSPLEKFKKFLDLVQEHLSFIDGLICEIAKYSFADTNKLSETHKKIIRNFIKSGDMKKQSLNAAYDLIFIQVIAMSNNKKLSDAYFGKIDSWGLTADQGIIELAKLISFSNKGLFICADLNESEKLRDYLNECYIHYNLVMLQRYSNTITQQKNFDIDNIINKSENLILKLENAAI